MKDPSPQPIYKTEAAKITKELDKNGNSKVQKNVSSKFTHVHRQSIIHQGNGKPRKEKIDNSSRIHTVKMWWVVLFYIVYLYNTDGHKYKMYFGWIDIFQLVLLSHFCTFINDIWMKEPLMITNTNRDLKTFRDPGKMRVIQCIYNRI